MDYQLIFRSRYGQFSAVVLLLLAVLFTAMVWFSDGPVVALQSLVLPASLVYFTWWIWAWPHVTADRRGITVYNQLRTYRISWDSFASAESRFGLYLSVPKNPEAGEDAAESSALDSISRSYGSTGPDDWDSDVEPTRRIYAAGVPARGGFTSSRLKKPSLVPTLDFSRGPKVTVRTEPHTAAQLLEEEKIYDTQPKKRPESYGPPRGAKEEWAAKDPVRGEQPYSGITVSTNWLLIAIFGVAVAGVVLYGVL